MRHCAILLIVASCLCGCVTREVDPAKVSFGDLLWGSDRLQEYLQLRRAQNDQLQRKIVALEGEVAVQRGRLSDVGRQIGAAQSGVDRANDDVNQLSREIAGKDAELALLNERVGKLKFSIEANRQILLKAQVDIEQRRRIDAQMATQNKEMAELESSIEFLRQSIERTVRSRIDQNLRRGF